MFATKNSVDMAFRALPDAAEHFRGSSRVEGGIVFLKEDLLEQVTSDATGNYTEGSTSFSSEDYFFLLVEYYLPAEGTVGKDDMNEEVAGTTDGRMVQYALARKGSEFGSAFFSEDINNGDMLCWTDTSNNLNLEFDYLSFTDTGDYTRGEPTFEKLTYNEEGKLKEYIKTKCGIPEGKTIVEKNAEGEETTVNVLDQQVKYWLDKQNDPLVKAALEAAAVKAGVEVKELSKISFDEYFKFAVAARPGGIRSGDMSNNRLAKKDNTTETSYSYYLPTISDHSGTDDHVIINNYLGNNGYLAIANQKIHVTKMMSAPEGYTLTEYQENEKFDFQVYVQGVTGKRTAVQTQYNEYSKTWERRLAYIDVLTDNSELLLTSGETRALFDLKKDGTTTTARQVVSGDDGQLYYADDQGNPTTEPCLKTAESLYYLYLPSNGEGEAERTRRLYQDPEYNGTADGYGDTDKNEYFKNNGTTTFFEEGQREVTGSEEGPENRDSYRKADDTRTAGTRTYWALDAELIPVSEVNEAEGTSGIMLESVKSWEHQADRETYQKLTYYTIVVRKPNGVTSDAGLTTPFKTRSQYMTKELVFGENANENDGGPNIAGTDLTEHDLYDKTIPSVDHPDLFGSVSSEDIAKTTAEFTLKHGEGLLLTGLGDSITYRFTEKLTEEQVKKGYTIKEISQQDSEGTSSGTTTIENTTEVYSVFGSTGGFEAQAHFGNSFNPGTISITKKLDAEEGTKKTEKDKNTEFWFSLKLDTKDGVGISPGEYGYTITDPEDDKSVTGTLKKYVSEESNDPDGNGVYATAKDTWTFKLKAGQTMIVSGLPVGSTYTYEVKEETPGDGYIVTDSDVAPEKNDDKTVTGTVTPETRGPIEIVFGNTKKKPEPAKVNLGLTKVLDCYKLRPDTITFEFDVEQNSPTPPKGPKFNDDIKIEIDTRGSDIYHFEKDAIIFPDDAEENAVFDEPGTYVYTITEKATNSAGVTYDYSVYRVKVEVKEEYIENTNIYTGKLVATVSIIKNGEQIFVLGPSQIVDAGNQQVTFSNRFNPDEVSISLIANKTLLGLGGSPVEFGDKNFSFSLVPLDGAPGPISEKTVATVKDSADGAATAAFDEITFT